MNKSINTFSKKVQAKGSTPFQSKNKNVSANTFAHRTPTKGSTTFISRTARSANLFAKKVQVKNSNAWTGDNLTSDEYGFDNPDGMAYGEAEYGGIKHFEKIKNRP